jgi:hypothetical protein
MTNPFHNAEFKPEDHDHGHECLAVALTAHLRPVQSDQPERRKVLVGDTPVIIIEVDVHGGDDHVMPVHIDSTGFDDEELADFLLMMSKALRSGMTEVPTRKSMAEELADILREAMAKPLAEDEPEHRPVDPEDRPRYRK